VNIRNINLAEGLRERWKSLRIKEGSNAGSDYCNSCRVYKKKSGKTILELWVPEIRAPGLRLMRLVQLKRGEIKESHFSFSSLENYRFLTDIDFCNKSSSTTQLKLVLREMSRSFPRRSPIFQLSGSISSSIFKSRSSSRGINLSLMSATSFQRPLDVLPLTLR